MMYLASPYSHADLFVREARYLAACKATLRLMLAGQRVYSPIVHNHQLARLGRLPKDFGWWEAYDLDMLRRCDRLVVLKIDGWQISAGVRAEIKFAESINMPVEYLDESKDYRGERYPDFADTATPTLRPDEAERAEGEHRA